MFDFPTHANDAQFKSINCPLLQVGGGDSVSLTQNNIEKKPISIRK